MWEEPEVVKISTLRVGAGTGELWHTKSVSTIGWRVLLSVIGSHRSPGFLLTGEIKYLVKTNKFVREK